MLHVDLQKADGDSKNGLVRILLNIVEDALHCPRHDAILKFLTLRFLLVQSSDGTRVDAIVRRHVQLSFTAENRVRLSRPGLAVRHDDPVEAVEHISDDGVRNLGVRVVLTRIHFKHAVEAKVSLVEAGAH